MNGQLHVPAAFSSGNAAPVPLELEAGGCLSSVGSVVYFSVLVSGLSETTLR